MGGQRATHELSIGPGGLLPSLETQLCRYAGIITPLRPHSGPRPRMAIQLLDAARLGSSLAKGRLNRQQFFNTPVDNSVENKESS